MSTETVIVTPVTTPNLAKPQLRRLAATQERVQELEAKLDAARAERLDRVREAITDGASQNSVAQFLGVSHTAVQKWIK